MKNIMIIGMLAAMLSGCTPQMAEQFWGNVRYNDYRRESQEDLDRALDRACPPPPQRPLCPPAPRPYNYNSGR